MQLIRCNYCQLRWVTDSVLEKSETKPIVLSCLLLYNKHCSEYKNYINIETDIDYISAKFKTGGKFGDKVLSSGIEKNSNM